MNAAVATGVFVIAFVSQGCPPCENFKRDLADGGLVAGVQVVVVDVAEQPEVARRCGVERTPTFVAVENELQLSRMAGYRGRGPLLEWLARLRRE